jgi:pimeloyl-ACP methyl ester carboxylesterase
MKIVKTRTSDGYHFTGLLSEPTSDPKGIIIHIHGMAGNIYLNSFYQAMHDQYPENGYAFLAGELRGSSTVQEFITDDGEGICGNAYERFEDCILDIQAWIDFAKELGYMNIWLQAHSLGPSKLAYFITQTRSEDVNGLIFISPSDMLGLVHDEAGAKDHAKLFPEAGQLVSEGKGSTLLSHPLWGILKLSAATYLNFFSNTSNTAIFNYNSLGLGWDVVNAIDKPVLAITGTKDDGIVPVMDAHAAMKLLEEELKNSPKVKTIVYDGAEHGFDGFPEEIVRDVMGFVG